MDLYSSELVQKWRGIILPLYTDDPDRRIIAALTHSKFRDMFGLIVIEAFPKYKEVSVNFARQWERKDMDKIHVDIKKYHSLQHWDKIIIDHATGHHLVRIIKNTCEVSVHVITTQNKSSDDEGIEGVTTLDMTEMAQLFLKFKLKHQIRFVKNPRKSMRELESEVSTFTEHRTEQGTMTYYAPGEENDHMIKSLMNCCFAVRRDIETGSGGGTVMGPLGKDSKFDIHSPTLDLDGMSSLYTL